MPPAEDNGWTQRKSEINYRLEKAERRLDAWEASFADYKDKRTEQLAKFAEDIRSEIAQLRSEVRDLSTNLKFRSGLYGAAAAMLPVLLMILFQQLSK